jgi:hypothetical protein
MNSKCPHCLKTHDIPDQYADKKIKCPSCAKGFVAVEDTEKFYADPAAPIDETLPGEPQNKSFWYKMCVVILIAIALCLWAQMAEMHFNGMLRAQESIASGVRESSIEEMIRTGQESQATRQTVLFGIAMITACIAVGNILHELRVIAHYHRERSRK